MILYLFLRCSIGDGSNMTAVGDKTSLSTWTEYKTKLLEFLNLWAEKSKMLIQSWITKRQKHSRQKTQ